MKPIRLTARAARDLIAIHGYISANHPAAAAGVVQRIHDALRRLEVLPYSAPIGPRPGTRQLSVPGLPYVAVYRIGDETVDVLGVFHTARDPEVRG